MQPWIFSLPALVTAAGFAWNHHAEVGLVMRAGVLTAPQSIDAHGYGQEPAPQVIEDWEGFWNETDLAAVMDFHVFGDEFEMLSSIVCDLGNTYLHAGAHAPASGATQSTGGSARENNNGSALFKLLNTRGKPQVLAACWSRACIDDATGRRA